MSFHMILAQESEIAALAEGSAPAETPAIGPSDVEAVVPADAPAAETAQEVQVPAGAAQQQPPPQGSGITMFVYLGLFLLLMYFMMIRPQKRREKERQALLAALKTGDRVLFAGGFIGTVANVKDKTLTVKIADNVKVEIARGAVSQVLAKGEAPEDRQG